MRDCVFCKIISKAIPSSLVSESDSWICFKDINPAAPNHLLIAPKEHIENLNQFNSNSNLLIGDMLLELKKQAGLLGVDEAGYRIVINCNEDGGQTVGHVHFHLLAGRSMGWPPG